MEFAFRSVVWCIVIVHEIFFFRYVGFIIRAIEGGLDFVFEGLQLFLFRNKFTFLGIEFRLNLFDSIEFLVDLFFHFLNILFQIQTFLY